MRRHLLALTSLLALATAAPAHAAPLTSHPRLWLTSADLPRLRAWAVSTNPMYTSGLLAAATAAKSHADASWNWGTGQPNANWHDTGSTNWEADATEGYAEFFAFMSLVDPDPIARKQWAMRARTLLMWAINQAALGPLAGAPFRDPNLPTYNRGNAWGEAWGLTVDWIYPSLTAADKAQIQKAFLAWSNEIFTVGNRAGQPQLLPGTLNDPRILGNDSSQTAYTQQSNQLQLRWAANNYSLGEMRFLTNLAIALDPADDPALDPTKSTAILGNSVHSYLADVLGYWLYQAYAIFETPAVNTASLNLTQPNISLGVASGGLPVEGSLYGESIGFLGETLLSLSTAGYTDTATYVPQAGFFKSAFWDQSIAGLLHLVAPAPYTPTPASGWNFLGQIYPVATYGDTLRTWLDPFAVALVAPLALQDQRTHTTARLNASRWISTNLLEGGPAKLYERAANIWGNSTASYGIFYFMMFDPNVATAPDPRPKLPRVFAAPAIGSVLARTDWSPTATWFTYRCSWELINHESGDCGQFQFYRHGQWLTKEWSNYAFDWFGYTSPFHNTLSLQNAPATLNAGSIWQAALSTGSQWNNGGNNGDPTTIISANDHFAYATSDMTNLYNHPDWYTPANNARDIQSASRSIVYLNPDYVVVYDRAQSAAAQEFKRFNLVLMNTPTITGHIARISAGGQSLTVQSLLPTTATITEHHNWHTNPAQEVSQTSALDTSYDRLVIEDPANPQSAHFLTVLTGTDAGTLAAPASVIHTIAGAAYDGAVVNKTAVMFAATLGQVFTTTSYTVPVAVKHHIITGLTPGATYDATITKTATTQTVTIAPGTTLTADIGGVLSLGFGASADPTTGGSSAPGHALVGPATGGGGGGGGGGTYPGGGYGAPLTPATDGTYYYDYWEKRVYWQQNGQWQVINDGNTITYTQTAAGYQGPGAPEITIADGTAYLDTVESRNFLQIAGAWILLLPPTSTGATSPQRVTAMR